MMAEGHWDSQKASQKERRTLRSRAEVHGDRGARRQEKGQEGEGNKDEGAHMREEKNDNRGGGSRQNSGVGGDMNQGALHRTEVGCHWSGSESGGDADEGPHELDAKNGSEASGVPSDMMENGSSREARQVEADGENTQVGSSRGREEKRETGGRSEQAHEWNFFGSAPRRRQGAKERERWNTTLRKGKKKEP